VTVWKFDGRGIDCGAQASAWVTKYLETELALVAFDTSLPRECSPEWTQGIQTITEFSDGYPILVISKASLAELNSRLPKQLPMERFRPNVVIDGVGAYDEDRMHEMTLGDVTLRMVKPSRNIGSIGICVVWSSARTPSLSVARAKGCASATR
jgi:uncharacterized protein YcbX